MSHWLTRAPATLAQYRVSFEQPDRLATTLVLDTVPPYLAGTVLRLRKETADELALRAQELENDRAAQNDSTLAGTGRGRVGLRERSAQKASVDSHRWTRSRSIRARSEWLS